jgi:hypothetical protein
VREALRGGFAESRALELHGQRMVERDFTTRGRPVTHLKDLDNALVAADRLGLTERPYTAATADLFRGPLEHAGDLDHAGLLVELERRNGIQDQKEVAPDEHEPQEEVAQRGVVRMAEVGNMPIPQKLLRQGVRDMIRISDARMSGTACGTVVLRVAPEAAAGGPLALVRNGDLITLDVKARSLHLHVDEKELAARRAAWVPPPPPAERGYVKMYVDHVLQANEGVDLDFLVGRTGSPVPRDNH